MYNLKTYSEFVTESVRDKMVPKGKDEILDSFRNADTPTKKKMLYDLQRSLFKTPWEFSKFIESKLHRSEWTEISRKIDKKFWFANEIIGVLKGHQIERVFRIMLQKKDFTNESVRDKMTPKSEKEGLKEFMLLDQLDMASTLYPECVEMFTTGLTNLDTPIVNDEFTEFLKREIGFDVWKTFTPKYKNYLTFDMVLEDLTKEQLIKLFHIIYSLKMKD